MVKGPINKSKVLDLLADIQIGVDELRSLVARPPGDFVVDRKAYAQAEHYLRRVLEGILTVGTHLVSRLNGKARDYQEVIVALGAAGIVTREFAERNKKLAGYRNRLVHLYWEVTPEEMFEVISEHLADLVAFIDAFKRTLLTPERSGLFLE